MALLMGEIETAIVTLAGVFVSPVITTLSILFSSICRVNENGKHIKLNDYRGLCFLLALIIIPCIWLASVHSIGDGLDYARQTVCYVKIISFSILGFSLFNINRYYSILKGANGASFFKIGGVMIMNTALTIPMYFLLKWSDMPVVYAIAVSTVIASFYLAYITHHRDDSRSGWAVSPLRMARILRNGGCVAVSSLFEIAMFALSPLYLAAYGVGALVVHQYFYLISTVAILFSYGVSVNAIYFVSSGTTSPVEYLKYVFMIAREKILYIGLFVCVIMGSGIVNANAGFKEFIIVLLLFCLFDALQIILAGLLRGKGRDSYVSITYFMVYSLAMAAMYNQQILQVFSHPAVNLWATFVMVMAVNFSLFLIGLLLFQSSKLALNN